MRIVLSIGLTERMKEKRLNGVMKEMRTGFIYQKRREMFNNLLVMVLEPFNYDLITFPLLSSGVHQSLYGYLYRVLLYKTGNAVIIATSPKGSVAMPSAKEI